MGNREALLAAAKDRVREHGYAGTTARDIASAAGVSLAAIGYHFGSLHALMNTAVFQATEDWGDDIGAAAATVPLDAAPAERFESMWNWMIESFGRRRPLLTAQFEVLAQIEHMPAARAMIAEGFAEGRASWAALFHGKDLGTDERAAHAVGTVYQALLSGLIAQWLVDQEQIPTGEDLAAALRTIAADLQPGSDRQAG